jgi:diaminohydroxyphosphoribosylaminopyrimidine deaminase/5-amino-6-(5-phosphoribosylamino)uracil reductase
VKGHHHSEGERTGPTPRFRSPHLDEAFRLAEQGRGRVHPNPLVGAVVVAEGEVVGRGAHLGAGLPHAEVVALEEAGSRARGATLYCTLEPCAHHGRTPPCADAIVEAGVARVVVPMEDPHPLVSGRGLARLRDAGVTVEMAGADERDRAEALNRPFFKYVETGLPYVTCKAAITLDGKVAAAGGDARWISGEESRALVHRWRTWADAVVIGAGTLRQDDPLLTVRAVEGRDPVRVVVSRRAQLPPDARLFTSRGGEVIVIAEAPEPAAAAALRERGADVAVTADGLCGALRLLAGRGLLEILVEGGPTLTGALLQAGLVDRLALFVAPVVLGRGAPDLLATSAPARVDEGLRLHEVSWRQIGDDLLVEGLVSPGEEKS